jgi:SAM-dependent methyltransferase/uncharacterized coiled-coil protein SlyX
MHAFVLSKLRIATRADVAALEQRCATLERRLAMRQTTLNALGCSSATEEAIVAGLAAATRLICRRISDLATNDEDSSGELRLDSSLTFDQQLEALRQLEPNAFEAWWQCFLNGKHEYQRTVEGNLSYGDHPGAFAFGRFVSPFLKGKVLDVGCGSQVLPTYLHGAADRADLRLFGLDPLLGDHPFEFHQGFAEFLPWKSHCFDTVIIATSFDHCLSLDKVTDELKRVLKPGGLLLIWVGFVRGAPEYNPRSPNLKAIDEYHLFHFDRPWFEAMMEKHFSVVECVEHDEVSHFYAFTTRIPATDYADSEGEDSSC